MISLHHAAAALVAVAAVLPGAAPTVHANPQETAAPRLVLEALDGKVKTRAADAGPLTSLAAAGAAFVYFKDVPVDRAENSEVAVKDLASIELAGGDRLAGAVRGGDGDELQVELRGGVPLTLSIDAIRSVVFPGRIPDSVTTTPTAGEDGDRLYLVASGSLDRAQGFVEEFGVDGVTFEDARLGARTFAWDRVAALFVTPFEDEDDGAEEEDGGAKGERVAVSLRGGGRLSGELRRIIGPVEGVQLVLGSDAEVTLPGRVVTDVVLDDGSFRFLGDLKPSREASTSLFGDELGFAWPMRVDRNVRGGPLVVAGVTYGRGLGVHAPSRLAWDLEGEGWKELRFGCGVDDTGAKAGSVGAVRFRVHGDGKVLWESEVLRAGGAVVMPLGLDVAGVGLLELEVDPAGSFTLDRADWVRAMLIR